MSTGAAYRVASLALTTARDNERVDAGASRIYFSRVDAPIYVRIGGSSDPLLRVAEPRMFCARTGQRIDAIYVTNSVGSGTVEILFSDELHLDFSSPPSAFGEPRVRAALIPGNASGTQINEYVLEGTANVEVLSDVLTQGSASVRTTLTNDLGWTIECTDVVTANQGVRVAEIGTGGFYPQVPLESILNGPSLSGDFVYEFEVDVKPEILAGTGNWMFRFGLGLSEFRTSTTFQDLCVGFGGGQSLTTGYTGIVSSDADVAAVIIGNQPSTRVVHYANTLGAYVGSTALYKVRIGMVGGVAFVEWYVNDTLADRFDGFTPATFFQRDNGAGTRLGCGPFISAGRAPATDTFRVRFGEYLPWSFSVYRGS